MTATRPPRGGAPSDTAADRPYEPMAADRAAVLTEFARACKSAARAVSLYPGTHPAIGVSLARLVQAVARLVTGPSMALTVDPHVLVIDGSAPARPDLAVVELAGLLHERLVGSLRVDREADVEDWQQLLRLLARSPDDLLAAGGIAQAWTATGRRHFEIAEIDYAEVLREREGQEGAGWDRVLAHCLRGESAALDDTAMRALLEAVRDPARLGGLIDRLQEQAGESGLGTSAQVAALFQLLRAALSTLAEGDTGLTEGTVLDAVAQASPRLTPEMLLAILEQRTSDHGPDARLAQGITERITPTIAAAFVSQAVTRDHGATDRLAQAFSALIPAAEHRAQVLELARADAEAGALGREGDFNELWTGAADMLVSYSDSSYVSADYARELSGARTQAMEVEQLADDPPERIEAWLSSVSPAAIPELDLAVTLDLLALTTAAGDWEALAAVVSAEIERRAFVGEVAAARSLAERLARETGPEGRPELAAPAAQALENLSAGALVRHVVAHLRKAHEKELAELTALCLTVGRPIVRPLAEAITVEDYTPTIRRLREILIAFGPAGRQAVEPLKNSSNPAVRRTAVDLLRVFGGNEALRELTTMLSDTDPEVQREAVRAIVQIGTPEATAMLKTALEAGAARRELVVRQLVALHDARAVPLLCHAVAITAPKGAQVALHETVIDALAGLGPHEESTRLLRTVLHRGEWWAPRRTALLRRAAATALHRIGSDDALAVLAEAASSGPRGVRRIAQEMAARRPRSEPAAPRGR